MIDLNTPLLGPVDTDRATIIAAFSGGAYDAATVAAFADSVLARCAEFGFRASILCGQVAKETGFFHYGGQVKPAQFNFAGLGATNGGAAGASFRTVDEGVCAVLTHHQVWMHGDVQNWPPNLQRYISLDARYAAVLSTGRAGSVTAIGSYVNGNWAYTATIPVGSLANGYAAGIATIANQFTNGGPPVTTADFPTAADLGFPVRLEPTDFVGADRPLADIDWNVIHDTEGHFEGDIAVLTHGSRNGSVHAIIGREPGQFVASVPIRTTAWTAGNDTLGARAIQVELSKATDEHGYTDWQYTAAAAFFRWCEGQGVTVPRVYLGLHPKDDDNGPLPDERGYIGHAGVPDGSGGWGGFAHHQDPGPEFQWDRFIALLGDAPPPPPDGQYLVDGKDVGAGIHQLYTSATEDTSARLRIFGLCVAGQHDAFLVTSPTDAQRAKGLSAVAHSVVAVTFERVTAIWDRGRTPAPFDCRIPMRGEQVGQPDEPYIQAILHSMELVGEKP